MIELGHKAAWHSLYNLDLGLQSTELNGKDLVASYRVLDSLFGQLSAFEGLIGLIMDRVQYMIGLCPRHQRHTSGQGFLRPNFGHKSRRESRPRCYLSCL